MSDIVAPNNAALDTFARTLKKAIDKSGVKDLDVVRLYSYESEVDGMRQKCAPFIDRYDEVEAVIQQNEFDETDKLLAAYIVIKASVDIHTERDQRAKQKGACRNMSLHEAAAGFLDENQEKYIELVTLLNSITPGEAMSPKQSSLLKSGTKTLYRDFLASFKGIIYATPMAAASSEFQPFFKPHLTLIDEAGRLREIELLSVIAFFDGPYIVVGDQQQLKPYIGFDPTANNEVQSLNPFAKQLTYSTLERAVDAGAVDAYFTFNHRAYAQLSNLPSKFIYRGMMRPYRGGRAQYPNSVKNFNQFLKDNVAPQLPRDQNRVMVTLPGSWVSYIGSSARNIAHARWAISQAILAITDESLTSLDGGQIEILIMPYYRAQVHTYQELLQKAVEDGKLTPKQRARIRVVTLDSLQGDEADLVFIDLTRTDNIGFCKYTLPLSSYLSTG
jgi:superfamily I DNA and/or RNA helicase